MTLFSSPTDFYSHRTRLVLAEKNIRVEVVKVEGTDLPEDLLDLNPYHSVPTLIDRDLVLYVARRVGLRITDRGCSKRPALSVSTDLGEQPVSL